MRLEVEPARAPLFSDRFHLAQEVISDPGNTFLTSFGERATKMKQMTVTPNGLAGDSIRHSKATEAWEKEDPEIHSSKTNTQHFHTLSLIPHVNPKCTNARCGALW